MAIEIQSNNPRATAEKSAIDARQGVISGRIFAVLTTSLILSVIAIGVAFWAVT
jgi:hypothetical protein